MDGRTRGVTIGSPIIVGTPSVSGEMLRTRLLSEATL
jgi:hypothetical protein